MHALYHRGNKTFSKQDCSKSLSKDHQLIMASQTEQSDHQHLHGSVDQGESHAQLSKDLSKKLSNLNVKVPTLSSVALKGEEKVSQIFELMQA